MEMSNVPNSVIRQVLESRKETKRQLTAAIENATPAELFTVHDKALVMTEHGLELKEIERVTTARAEALRARDKLKALNSNGISGAYSNTGNTRYSSLTADCRKAALLASKK